MRHPYLKQVMVLDTQSHNEYLEDFQDEPLSFWDFVNFTLGSLYDNEYVIEQIIPNIDTSKVLIIYNIKMIK